MRNLENVFLGDRHRAEYKVVGGIGKFLSVLVAGNVDRGPVPVN